MKHSLFSQLQKDRGAQRPVALVSRLSDGEQRLVYADQLGLGELQLDAPQLEQVRELLHSGRSALLADTAPALFVRSYVPAYRLFIVGAVHIAQFLAPMAQMAGFDVTVIDPRRAFATAERFPGIELCRQWPDETLAERGLNAQSALVVLAHDPKIDDPALMAALNSDAFYIGALGSRKTHAKRIDRLTEEGLGDALDRICAPIGINLGGRAAPEIAVSILSQLIQYRYGAN